VDLLYINKYSFFILLTFFFFLQKKIKKNFKNKLMNLVYIYNQDFYMYLWFKKKR
jgi:hypothetical protein